MNLVIKRVGQLFPKSVRRFILKHTRRPAVGKVQYGDLRRMAPISRDWGGDRGKPIDRYYIETFLAQQAVDIKGIVLEVGDSTYTHAFGRQNVLKSEVVHAAEGNPLADYVADFADAPHLPSNRFDCIICTQTLHLLPNIEDGIATLYRILKPGGVLLVTVPGISQIYRDEDGLWTDFWRFTRYSADWLFKNRFPESGVVTRSYGNVLAATSFLQGIATEELTQAELDTSDDYYHMLISVRAEKPTVSI